MFKDKLILISKAGLSMLIIEWSSTPQPHQMVLEAAL